MRARQQPRVSRLSSATFNTTPLTTDATMGVEYQGARGGRACADTKATSLTNELAFKPSLIGYSSASLKAKEAHAVACSKREIASATYLSTKSMSFCDSRISLCRNATKW